MRIPMTVRANSCDYVNVNSSGHLTQAKQSELRGASLCVQVDWICNHRPTCLSTETRQSFDTRECARHLLISVNAFAFAKDMKGLFGAKLYGWVNACDAEFGRKCGDFAA